MRYVQLVLISPSIVIVTMLALDWFGISDFISKVFNMFGIPHFFAMERIFYWIGLAVFYTSPILFLYNIVLILLARRWNPDNSWIETVMMAIVIIASCLLFLVVMFLIMALQGGDIMPVPAD